jgi:glycosyltransferase involved in cell wall biosynthesis
VPPRKISVVITTYNWPQALAAVLTSLRVQTARDFDVIVADDGSGPATKEVIQSFQANFPVPLIHVWQPDDGPRVSAIRNRAIEASTADYIIFTDGDCLGLPDFVVRHRELAEEGWFVAGKRSWLRDRLTARVLAQPDRFVRDSRARWLLRSLGNQCTRPSQFLPLPCDRASRSLDWRQVQTCNVGVWREDCYKVNGFDEQYLGAGLEDSDFAVRLIRKGIRRKRGDHASIVLHLNHPRRAFPPASRSPELFKELLACDRSDAIIGLEQNKRAA